MRSPSRLWELGAAVVNRKIWAPRGEGRVAHSPTMLGD